MPVGKKFMVVASVLATGAGAALFFRKDASRIGLFGVASTEGDFGEHVERRLAPPGTWATDRGSPKPVGATAPPARRPVTVATASIQEPKDIATENQPTFQRNFNGVGTLLQPIDGIAAEDASAAVPAEPERRDAEVNLAGGAVATHRVVDGDTLSKIAIRYLGSGDRYIEIFEFNRDVLASADLLPIGAMLKIPPRGVSAPRDQAPAKRVDPPALDLEVPLRMVPVGEGPARLPR